MRLLPSSQGIPAGVALRAAVKRPVPHVARVTKYLGQRRLLLGGRIEANPVGCVVSHGTYLSDDTPVKRRTLACELAYSQREGARITR